MSIHDRIIPTLIVSSFATLAAALAVSSTVHHSDSDHNNRDKQRAATLSDEPTSFSSLTSGAPEAAEATETSQSSSSADSTNTGNKYSAPSDAKQLTLALKYVAFLDNSGQPVLNQNSINKLTQEINGLYAPCNIHFVAEEFKPVDPKNYGLEFNTQSMNELNPIRSQFSDNKRLVVINTGDWNHSSMGSANAWTTMPGENPAGAVIEANAASFAGIVAHELGHYLSLDHKTDDSNLMNPIIYPDSTAISLSQCDEMRNAAVSYWTSAIR